MDALDGSRVKAGSLAERGIKRDMVLGRRVRIEISPSCVFGAESEGESHSSGARDGRRVSLGAETGRG